MVPLNGKLNEVIKYIMIPRDHISDLCVAFSSLSYSGDWNSRVVDRSCVILFYALEWYFDNPKSAITKIPDSLINIFSGFRSRCITFLSCK
jgi:hypothetical protein